MNDDRSDTDMETTEINFNNSAPRKPRTDDPQTVVTGKLKPGAKSDLIVFTLNLGLLEIVAIANVPLEGTTEAPVFLKWKVKKSIDPTVAYQKPDFTDDPQPPVTGRLRAGEKNDTIVCHIPVGLLELICIISIPYEGATEAPVYCKWKIRKPRVD